LLDHVGGSDQCNENDAAKWMSYYIGKKYDGPFTLALEALSLPVVQHLDEKALLQCGQMLILIIHNKES
jgi:hypothetical protein